jgi:hypothetical protein
MLRPGQFRRIDASAQCGAMLEGLLHMRASCGVIRMLRCQGCDSWEIAN